MAFLKKIWKDRVTEYPTRRTLKKSDGSTEIVTVERAEGQVSVEGDPFSAATMNDLEDRVADEFESLNSNMIKMYIASGVVTYNNGEYYANITVPSTINLLQNLYGMTLSYINPNTGENVADSALVCRISSSNTMKLYANNANFNGLTVKATV